MLFGGLSGEMSLTHVSFVPLKLQGVLGITHSAGHLYANAQLSAISRMTWRKCRLLDRGHKTVAMTRAGSHVPRILHWFLTEEVVKAEKGRIFWVHTYPTTSRPRGRETCAKFGRDRCRNVDLYEVQTKTNKKPFHLYKNMN